MAGGIGAGFAFYKVNGRPLIVAAEHGFSYLLGNKLYLWKQREAQAPQVQKASAEPSVLTVPRLSQSRLKDLSWSLNIKDQNQPQEGNVRGDLQL